VPSRSARAILYVPPVSSILKTDGVYLPIIDRFFFCIEENVPSVKYNPF
jgi:hypothetical protein